MLKLIADAARADLQHCTFFPTTNCTAGATNQNSGKRLYELATPVHDRREREKERRDREKLALERSKCPFAPNLEKPNVKGPPPRLAAAAPAKLGAAALDPPPDPTFVGVGLVLKTEQGERFPLVKTIHAEGAAAEYNRTTQSDDVIIRVEDQVLEVAGLSCADKKAGDLADALRGPVASTVVVTFGACSSGKTELARARTAEIIHRGPVFEQGMAQARGARRHTL